jgi:hypothetical protein
LKLPDKTKENSTNMKLLFAFAFTATLANAFVTKFLPQNKLTKVSATREQVNKVVDQAFDTIDSIISPISIPKSILLSKTGKSRIEINELVLQLEKINPTKSPAQSPLVNGVWELVVTGVSDPSLLIYQVIKLIPGGFIEASNLTITISSVQPRVKASSTISIGNFKTDIDVITELDAVSGTVLKETYKSGKIGSLDIPLTSLPLLNRELVVSYVDEDILIVRDFLGSPEVLRRVDFYNTGRGSASVVMEGSSEEDVPSA